jgi:hypothetical protein
MKRTRSRWTFYGTSEHRPTVGQFIRQLEELGYPVSYRSRQLVDGQLVGYAVAEPSRSLIETPLTLTMTGKAGELNLHVMVSSSDDAKALRRIRFPRKPRLERLTVVARMAASDEGPGRSYRDLVRPVLCLLGEFFPRGMAERTDDQAVFQTTRMRQRLSTLEVGQYHFEGFLNFPVELLDVIRSTLDADPVWMKLCALAGRKLSFHTAPAVLGPLERDRCLDELSVLARHAKSGTVTITGPSGFHKNIHTG